MRNGTRRLLSLLTAMVMLCSLFAVPAAAEEAGTGGKIVVTSYFGEDVKYGNEGYFIAINADNNNNKDLGSLPSWKREAAETPANLPPCWAPTSR